MSGFVDYEAKRNRYMILAFIALVIVVAASLSLSVTAIVKESSSAPVSSSMEYVVNVVDYGAVGNGTKNDTQAFIDAVNSGASHIFVPGTKHAYILEGGRVRLKSNQTIFGVGKDSLLKLKAMEYAGVYENSIGILTCDTVSHVVIRDLAFDGDKSNSFLAFDDDAQTNIEAIDIKGVIDTEGDNHQFSENIHLLRLHTVDMKGDAIDIDCGKYVVVDNCYAESCDGFGVHLSDKAYLCTIMNCTSVSCGIGNNRAGFDIYNQTLPHNKISNCSAIGCQTGFIVEGSSALIENCYSKSALEYGFKITGIAHSLSTCLSETSTLSNFLVSGFSNIFSGCYSKYGVLDGLTMDSSSYNNSISGYISDHDTHAGILDKGDNNVYTSISIHHCGGTGVLFTAECSFPSFNGLVIRNSETAFYATVPLNVPINGLVSVDNTNNGNSTNVTIMTNYIYS
jgi:hypothetical protein